LVGSFAVQEVSVVVVVVRGVSVVVVQEVSAAAGAADVQ
jgi:hypothetical protein